MTRDEGRYQSPKPLVLSDHSETGNSRLASGSQARKSSMNNRNLGLTRDLGLRAGPPKGYARQMRTESRADGHDLPLPSPGDSDRSRKEKRRKTNNTHMWT